MKYGNLIIKSIISVMEIIINTGSASALTIFINQLIYKPNQFKKIINQSTYIDIYSFQLPWHI